MMTVFATYNLKGGVGKTATAVNLAYLSASEGARTLVWDLDPQAAATFYFRIRAKVKGGGRRLVRGRREIEPLIRGTDFECLDLLPADFSYRNLDLALDGTKKPLARLRRVIRPVRREYDRLFLDCAPSISLVSESVFAAADVLLVPIIPTTLSVRSLDQLGGHLGKKGPRGLQVLAFFCMVDRRKSLHRRICREADGGPFQLLETRIPYSSLVEKMGVHRAPLFVFAGGSPPSRAYRQLWEEIKGAVGQR